MLTGRFRQSSLARLRYVVDIGDWMASGEIISGLEVLEADGLTIEELAPLPPSFAAYQFMVSDGTPGRVHRLKLSVTTSLGQRRVDSLEFIMEGIA